LAQTQGERAHTAVFYSINNSLQGPKGLSFGNLLINRVVGELASELPSLKTFVTLSPAPGFAAWLANSEIFGAAELATDLEAGAWLHDAEEAELLRHRLGALAATYFREPKGRKGAPRDPVARFHLGNGAAAWRANWPADRSDGALTRAHEAFMRDGTVATGAPLQAVLSR
jgi:malonyl-CoA decarboxylase